MYVRRYMYFAAFPCSTIKNIGNMMDMDEYTKNDGTYLKIGIDMIVIEIISALGGENYMIKNKIARLYMFFIYVFDKLYLRSKY